MHSLPKGYVLKREKKKLEQVKEVSMEKLVEEERANLLKSLKAGERLTPVNEETFKDWKRKKIMQKKRSAL